MTVASPTKSHWAYAARSTLIWAVLGAATATIAWGTLNGLLVVARGASVTWFAAAFIAGLYFGGFVALLLLAPYWVLLFLYATAVMRRRSLEQDTRQFLVLAFCLAVPVGLIVFFSFLAPWSALGPFWDTAPIAGPMALASTWAGLVFPRVLIPSLRPGTWLVAA